MAQERIDQAVEQDGVEKGGVAPGLRSRVQDEPVLAALRQEADQIALLRVRQMQIAEFRQPPFGSAGGQIPQGAFLKQRGLVVRRQPQDMVRDLERLGDPVERDERAALDMQQFHAVGIAQQRIFHHLQRLGMRARLQQRLPGGREAARAGVHRQQLPAARHCLGDEGGISRLPGQLEAERIAQFGQEPGIAGRGLRRLLQKRHRLFGLAIAQFRHAAIEGDFHRQRVEAPGHVEIDPRGGEVPVVKRPPPEQGEQRRIHRPGREQRGGQSVHLDPLLGAESGADPGTEQLLHQPGHQDGKVRFLEPCGEGDQILHAGPRAERAPRALGLVALQDGHDLGQRAQGDPALGAERPVGDLDVKAVVAMPEAAPAQRGAGLVGLEHPQRLAVEPELEFHRPVERVQIRQPAGNAAVLMRIDVAVVIGDTRIGH